MSPTSGPYSNPGATGATTGPYAGPPHFLHTQEAIEEALREAGHGDLPDLNDVIFVVADAARGALGVCSFCDGTGEYRVDPADSVGPEDCGRCDGSGWARAARAAAPAPPVDVAARLRAVAKILNDAAPYLGSTSDIETLKRLADCIEADPDDAEAQAIARALTGEATDV